MADLYDDEDDGVEGIDYNFTPRAQAVFDQLNNDTDFTWYGIAQAFARRYTRADIEELIRYLDEAMGDIDE